MWLAFLIVLGEVLAYRQSGSWGRSQVNCLTAISCDTGSVFLLCAWRKQKNSCDFQIPHDSTNALLTFRDFFVILKICGAGGIRTPGARKGTLP